MNGLTINKKWRVECPLAFATAPSPRTSGHYGAPGPLAFVFVHPLVMPYLIAKI